MKELDLEKLSELAGKEAAGLEDELHRLARLLHDNFDLRVFIENVSVPAEAKKKLIIEVFGQPSKLLQQLIDLLLLEKLEKQIIKLAEGFTRLTTRKTGTLFAEVETAFPLSEAEKREIAAFIGGKVVVREVVRPALIGGIKVRVNDGRYFDGSLLGGLARLKESLANA